MGDFPRPCITCGIVIPSGSRCADCTPRRNRNHGPRPQYSGNWSRLSKQARRLQPWCTDCGTPDNLSLDHTPASHAKAAAGQRLTIRDVRDGLLIVRCMTHNHVAGHARGKHVTRTN